MDEETIYWVNLQSWFAFPTELRYDEEDLPLVLEMIERREDCAFFYAPKGMFDGGPEEG